MSNIHFVQVNGTQLAVEDAGGSDVVMLLHGFASDRSTWDFVWNDFVNAKRAIRYDLRGFGNSSADNSKYRHTEDLLGLLDALGIKRVALVGISLGGSVALNFALDHSDRVSHLALVSPGITAWDWSDDWRDRWRAITVAAQSGDVEAARNMWVAHPIFATTLQLPKAAAKLHDSLSRYSGSIWIEGDHEEDALPDLDRLPLLKVPTLLLSGTADLPDFRLIADFIEAAAPNVRRVDYDNAGHMLNLERPEDVTADILQFLER
jgi:pimeloyl-ACP methyl ester carboxylesterase